MTDDDLAPLPTVGRVHRGRWRIGPGSATPLGRARLDAIVDWLQQIAYEDIVDAGLENDSVWVVRRTSLRIRRFPVFGEQIELRTACSGTGPLVAERRTSIVGDRGGAVEASALWVPLDPETLRPRRTERFLTVYGPSAGGRRVRARLRHTAPPPEAESTPWTFCAADLDVAGHVNNAAAWRALEEELGNLAPDRRLAVDVEHPGATFAGPARIARDGTLRWILDAAGGVTVSADLRD